MSESKVAEMIVEDGIATITMTRPDRRNAFTQELQDYLSNVVSEITRRDDIDAVVLRGSGGCFSGGGDIKGMLKNQPKDGQPGADYRKRFYAINDWIQRLRNLEVPVIAAVDGAAYGGGFALALCADFVLCSPTARFCSVFCRIGAVPDCGIMYVLPRMIGMQRAKEIMYTGRPVFAEEAKEIGIAFAVHPADELLDAAMTLAKRLQLASRKSLALTKRITNQSLDLDSQSLLEMEAAAQEICFNTDYNRDAVARFTRKEPLLFNWES
ncbi:enoyl-CoA hydratase/isomerase family protein [uncultured Sneathiella sp.]|uniref:enoyl-CoA hydratase/isomerase family protein n=1 Tax=uncultured Sneathiella sp. TaxID=879315 RepID=UPI002596A778|nr:enoyl-CoA hydratase/isomerase family protein [uncultured Sneathiella sp.]